MWTVTGGVVVGGLVLHGVITGWLWTALGLVIVALAGVVALGIVLAIVNNTKI